MYMCAIAAQAQGIAVKSLQVPSEHAVSGSTEAVHPTEWLIEQARLQGTLRVEKNLADRTGSDVPADIGDRKEFKVLSFITRDVELIEFELTVIDESVPPRFQVWVEVAELESDRFPEDSVNEFVDYLGTQTPAGSWNADEGIVSNMKKVFGDPPDVDGDGITEFLILDIRDNWNGTTVTSYVPTFVFPQDLQSTGNGNGADIVYVDAYPGLSRVGSDRISGFVTRELAALVMINHNPGEIPFVRSGVVYWAPVALGFAASDMEYLSHADRYNRGMYDYDRMFGEFTDLRRGELFLNYIADQFGILNAGSIARVDGTGSSGLRTALEEMEAGIELEELVENFHAANGLNFPVPPQYGYTTTARSGVRAGADPVIDGAVGSATPATSVAVEAGGVAYVEWNNVEDFSLSVTLGATNDADSYDIRAVIFAVSQGQDLTAFVRSEVPSEDISFDGKYERVLLVLAHTIPDGGQGTVSYSAEWEPVPQGSTVDIVYDSGSTVEGTLFSISENNGPASQQSATQFNTPKLDGQVAKLDRVWLSHLYLSQFSTNTGVPRTAPRDFELIVWGPGSDDRPGGVLFRQEMEDTRPFMPGTLNLQLLEIDMTPYVDPIGPLPDTIYIGTAEVGSDVNYHVFAPSPHDGAMKNHSFIYQSVNGEWRPLWDVQLSDSAPDLLEGFVLGTRARFRFHSTTDVGVATSEVPEGARLDNNYPNPFNEVTRITYTLDQHGPVHLSVMDLLGRRIEVLVNAEQGPGEHQVDFDGAHLSNGVYIYRLEHAGRVEAHRMVLVR